MFGPDAGPPEPRRALDPMSWCCPSEPHTGRSRRGSMVVIGESRVHGNPDGKDRVLGVFPPSNHENLPVPSGPCDERRSPSPILPRSSGLRSSPPQFFTPSSSSASSSSSSCSSSFSSSDVDEELQEEPQPSDSAVQVGEPGQATGLLGFGFRVLGSKVFGAVSSSFGRSSARGGLFWLSVTSAAAAAAALWWVYARFRLLRLRHRERVDGLTRGVKERDEKIAHLLHQIAQMNEVLLSRHKALTSKLPG